MSMNRQTRRRVLQSILAGPALAALGPSVRALGQDADEIITAADKALDVFDFERAARGILPPAHWGYLATGVDGDETLHANRAGFANYSLRVRRMLDLSKIDMSVNLFGTTWETPIFLRPGRQPARVPRGGRTRRGAGGQVEEASPGPVHGGVHLGRGRHGRARRADLVPALPHRSLAHHAGAGAPRRSGGCPVIALTVDLQGGSNRLTAARSIPRDSRDCTQCHQSDRTRLSGFITGKPMFDGLDISKATDITPISMNWDYIRRLRDIWPRKLVIKGIVTREDAELAVEHGLDGVLVSNHGGRAEDSGRASIDSLVEVVAGARGRVPVLVDGGFRRGTDVFKALALGATAVGIGRPYIWGLASFGQEGVEKVLDILRDELLIAMRQAGTRSIAEISRSFIVDSRR